MPTLHPTAPPTRLSRARAAAAVPAAGASRTSRIGATLRGSLLGSLLAANGAMAAANLPNPVLFVTQVPVPEDFATVGSVFANHLTSMQSVARGGDLWIRYTDGSLRNLTAEAGYGNAGAQAANAIAVRDPAVHFSGSKAVFSMLIGAPTAQYQWITKYWQLYEISGFGVGQTIAITRVPGQPADTNNVEPTYASDGSIIFVSDRSRDGQRHLYPQLDEYESTPTPSGLWKLNPANASLSLLQHAPSGSFRPLVDSFGRVVFTRWDHLQRDQQADNSGAGTFNWTSESATAAKVASTEMFPEGRIDNAVTFGLRVNHFFPWTINQDGSGEETVNHIGRHELFGYFNRSLRNDPSLFDFSDGATPPRANTNIAENWLQIAEDPTSPGRFFAIDAPEFYTHSAGQIISINGAPNVNAANMQVNYLTPRSTRDIQNSTPPADFTGHYRNPLPLSNGKLVASWVAEPRQAGNDGTRPNPNPRYKFRLYSLINDVNGYVRTDPNGALTGGITKSVSWWDPDVRVTYNGPLWELSPVEVRSRAVPANTMEGAPQPPEAQAFAAAAVDFAAFRSFLAARGLGVLVSRNVTTRDGRDKQQPYNLRVPGGVQSVGNAGLRYDISYMQFLQGDQIRGLGGMSNPTAGRRVLAQPMHDAAALQFMPPPPAGAPAGSVAIASDGSVAAIVPAQRAMAWQSTTADGTPVVRERYWVSVRPGEVRACGGCHGVNTTDQAGQLPAENMPQALKTLLDYWRVNADPLFKGNFD
ncbi:MAG TPA: hypothetical protein PK001_10420 [Dokdonella sp.]|uniref:HzsA-related protein n=2 Tax=Dokdonella sp. TaxID=2291710 RepID=UPI002B58AC9D|nr:hypothetical protein [Dokdonella sp.]HOX72146.1 hypothetical protein [Dokdonella sp.]